VQQRSAGAARARLGVDAPRERYVAAPFCGGGASFVQRRVLRL